MSDHYHCATIKYYPQIHFEDDVVELMYTDPKSLVHGEHNDWGLPERGVREHSDKHQDRGPKLPDGTYDQLTIKYNKEHASEMVAQYLMSKKFTFTIGPYYDDDDDDDVIQERKLQGELIIDTIGRGDEDSYEISHLRFHVGTTCVEMTLHSYGWKFEEHHYKWIVSHIYDESFKTFYDYHEFLLDGVSPKYALILNI